MFEYLGTILVDIDPGFDVLRYLTVRTLGGTVTGLLISILLGPIIIKSLKSMQFEQHVRVDGPESHYKKSGTPTIHVHKAELIALKQHPRAQADQPPAQVRPLLVQNSFDLQGFGSFCRLQ